MARPGHFKETFSSWGQEKIWAVNDVIRALFPEEAKDLYVHPERNAEFSGKYSPGDKIEAYSLNKTDLIREFRYILSEYLGRHWDSNNAKSKDNFKKVFAQSVLMALLDEDQKTVKDLTRIAGICYAKNDVCEYM